MLQVMPTTSEIRVWWHGLAALPSDRSDHAYYALRRVWGDHTMSGNRGFYRVGCEDHVTSALFQNWALFPDANWAAALVHAAGGTVGSIKRVRWAYECNEYLDVRLQPFHRRGFIIPDIMLVYEDEKGLGLVAFEVKKPGKATNASDARKLSSYVDLPSARHIARRYGCIVVSDHLAGRSHDACGKKWPVITWETLRDLQLAAARAMSLPIATNMQVAGWLERHFAYYGVRSESQRAPASMGMAYGTADAYRQIDAIEIPGSVRRFLKGSECVEAVRNNLQPDPPASWLTDEPTAESIRYRAERKCSWQTTEDRMICRWSLDWRRSRERTWL